MSVLQILKLAAADGAAAAVPPPNAVKAPSIVVQHQGGGSAPRSTPSVAGQPAATGADHTATPLTAAAPGQKVMHGGMLMSAEEQASAVQAEQEAAAEAAKNQPKAEKPSAPPKQDTPLHDCLLERMHERLDAAMVKATSDHARHKAKAASDPGFMAQQRAAGIGSPMTPYDPKTPGGVAGGVPSMKPPSGFAEGSWADKGMTLAKRLLAPKVKAPTIADYDMSPLAKSTPYQAAFARHLADPVATGDGLNPLWQLAGNYVGSLLGGKQPDMDQVTSQAEQALQTLQ